MDLSTLDALVARASGFTSDSRRAGPGEVFVALRGERADGHDFVAAVLAAGGLAVVERGAAARLGLAEARGEGRLVEVDDPHLAHREIARRFRARFAAPVVGIGGSSGKTTAKEFLRAMLETTFRVAATERSQNGEQGIPKTLEKLRPGIEIAIVEIGIDAPGDMARHAALVAPDVAVLTSIGEEHLSRLGTVETVFREETILFDATLARGGAAFAPEDDPWLARLRDRAGVRLVPGDPERVDARFSTPLSHRHARRNAALAAAVALHLGVPPDAIARALPTLALPSGRGGERRLPDGSILVLDHYNANPSSMRAGLEHARRLAESNGLPLRLVLGDMLDLGEATRAAHEGLAGEIRGARAETLWLVGPEMSRLEGAVGSAAGTVRAFPDARAAAAEARSLLLSPAVVLFKGSRGMTLEVVVEAASAP